MSRRFASICALVLSSSISPLAREACAQAAPKTVSILRRTAVHTAPSAVAPTIAFLNPSTFEVTQIRAGNGFVRLLLREIDRRRPASGYGYIAAEDVAVDSGATESTAAARQPDTVVPARTATTNPPRPDTASAAPSRQYPLETIDGLRPHNVTLVPETHAGKRGVRVAISDDARRRIEQTPAGEQFEQLVVVEGTDFADGVIEAEIAGVPGPSSGVGARGFVGIAFRLQPDLKTYDAFYLRPTNGRADDQERRNHSAQYISHPAWTWNRLRQETPSRYEAYVDLVPDAWTPIRIEVRGNKARLFVNGETQPTLIVNDVKSGEHARGAIALWIDPGTIAHFRNLRVSP